MFFHQPFNSLGGNKYNINVYKDITWNFHFHKNFEIIYIISGEVECTINSEKQVLCAGDFGMCLSNEIHAYKPQEDAVYWVCVFSEDCAWDFANQVKGKAGQGFKFNCSDSIKNYLDENIIYCEKPSLLIFKSCLYAICDQYLSQIELVDRDSSRLQAMAIITDYVSQNFRNNIKLSDIAELLGYDYNYVSRYFHSVFNMSFKDFVNLYRLDAALNLIERGDKKLLEIAYESGFQSLRNFNNCFKKQYGICPSQYKIK